MGLVNSALDLLTCHPTPVLLEKRAPELHLHLHFCVVIPPLAPPCSRQPCAFYCFSLCGCRMDREPWPQRTRGERNRASCPRVTDACNHEAMELE